MKQARHPTAKAFTLVEMLITVSIFSMMIGVLVSGVFAGTRSWIKGDRLLRRSIAARTAVDLMRRDIENARVWEGSDTPALLFDTDEPNRPVIQSRVVLSSFLAYEKGSCRVVTWEVIGEAGETRWVRSSVPCRPSDESEDAEVETILKEVESITLSFRYEDEWTDEPRDYAYPDQLAIIVSLQGSPPIRTLGSVLIRAEAPVEP